RKNEDLGLRDSNRHSRGGRYRRPSFPSLVPLCLRPTKPNGNLKVYLGYAAGVGKTFQMLADGHAAAQRGVDVVVAYFQPHARPDTIEKAQGLEMVPHRKIEYRGKTF